MDVAISLLYNFVVLSITKRSHSLPNLQAITYDEFNAKYWQQAPNFEFISGDTVCPLTAQELSKAILDMPVAFIENDDTFTIVAVLGLLPESNLFVDEVGRWVGRYIPAQYRAYPFVLAENTAVEDQLVFCVNKDSGLISEDDSHEPFFESEDSLSAHTKQIMDLLEALYANRAATQLVCAKLSESGLLKPWHLEIQLTTGPQKIEGLFTVDESALNALDGEAFIELRDIGALPVAYCQLLSMQNIDLLMDRL